MGDKGKSGTNQRLCYLLSAYNVDYGKAWGSDKHMGKQQVKNICMPAGHTVAGEDFIPLPAFNEKEEVG